MLILRMFFRLSLRISAEALKISEFSDNSRKIGSRKIAAGCLDFFYVHTRSEEKNLSCALCLSQFLLQISIRLNRALWFSIIQDFSRIWAKKFLSFYYFRRTNFREQKLSRGRKFAKFTAFTFANLRKKYFSQA